MGQPDNPLLQRDGGEGHTLASVRIPQYQGLVVSVRTASSFSCSSDTWSRASC